MRADKDLPQLQAVVHDAGSDHKKIAFVANLSSMLDSACGIFDSGKVYADQPRIPFFVSRPHILLPEPQARMDAGTENRQETSTHSPTLSVLGRGATRVEEI